MAVARQGRAGVMRAAGLAAALIAAMTTFGLAAQPLPALQEFYFDTDPAAVPMVVVPADLMAPLLFSWATVSSRLSAAPALSSVPLLVSVTWLSPRMRNASDAMEVICPVLLTERIALALLLALAGLAIYYYNRLVFNRARVAEAWSGIDVQLKRRASLIPALVECVRQYMSYEQGTLQALVQERMRAVQLADSPLGERAPVEAHLGTQLRQLFALVEDYPALKADGQFLDLQRTITEVENHIQMARRYYNGAVRELNVLVESVPSNLVARPFAFTQAEYFSLDDPRDAQSPKMEF